MLNSVSSYQGRTRLIIDEVFATSNQIRDGQLHGNESIVQQLRHQSQLLNDIQAAQSDILQNGQEHFNAQRRLLEGIANRATEYRNSLQLEASQAQRARSLGSSPSNLSRTVLSQSIISVRARVASSFVARHQRPVCPPSCGRSCHTLGWFQTPWLLNNTLGSVFVGYSGHPFAFTKCASEDCQGGFHARVIYTFPVWLLRKMIDICLAGSKGMIPT